LTNSIQMISRLAARNLKLYIAF